MHKCQIQNPNKLKVGFAPTSPGTIRGSNYLSYLSKCHGWDSNPDCWHQANVLLPLFGGATAESYLICSGPLDYHDDALGED